MLISIQKNFDDIIMLFLQIKYIILKKFNLRTLKIKYNLNLTISFIYNLFMQYELLK